MPKIEHVGLFAADPTSLKSFYEQAFGLRVIQDNSTLSPPGYFLASPDGGPSLEIIGRPAGTENVNQRHVCHVAFEVADFDASKADLERRGVTFETETEVHNDAMHTAFFRDPEGNRLQIVTRLRPLGS